MFAQYSYSFGSEIPPPPSPPKTELSIVVEAAIVLIAGVTAFPATLIQKGVAIMAGFLFVQALNVVRIISLFYLGQWSYAVFEWFHLHLWPVLIMLDVLVVFAIYLQWLGKSTPASEAM